MKFKKEGPWKGLYDVYLFGSSVALGLGLDIPIAAVSPVSGGQALICANMWKMIDQPALTSAKRVALTPRLRSVRNDREIIFLMARNGKQLSWLNCQQILRMSFSPRQSLPRPCGRSAAA